jgi:sterol desaturase/sphingolipid hydroxylase (fatty acid hydroxylase superfamily)
MAIPPHRAIQAELPSWYRGDLHAAAHFAVIGGATLACAVPLLASHLAFAALVPLFVPFWSVVEYAIHRWVLHAIVQIWPQLTRDHGVHHRYFPADDMFLTTHHDVYRVLLRPLDVVAVEILVLLVCGPIWLASPGLCLAAATGANLYFLLYELAHAGSHLESWAKQPWWRRSAVHHRAHHAEEDSQRFFANVFPWVDRMFGT